MKKIICAVLSALSICGTLAAQSLDRDNSVYGLMNRTDLTLSETDALAKKQFELTGTGKGTGYKHYQRWKFERQFHVDEQGYYINPQHEQAEYENFLTNHGPQANGRIGYIPAGNWTQQGPTIWTRTSGWNPGNGRLFAMAIHPSNLNTIYVGSPGGGLWKTTNGGTTWTPLTDHNALWMYIYSLAIDPLNQNIIYAGTGNSGNQIIKSTDGGANWTVIGSGPTGNIRKILIHPTSTNIVFAAATNGLFRSTNGGTTWAMVSSSQTEDIEFKPGSPSTMYAAGNTSIRRSTDTGVTWTALGSAQGITNTGRALIAVTPANSNVVYVVQATGNTFGRLYYSSNSGASFTTKITGNAAVTPAINNFFGYFPDGTDTRGQANHDMAICVSPTNANEVYIAGIIVFKSTNGGTSFTAMTEWGLPNSTGYNHADVHGLEFVGNTNLYSISDGGLYRSTDYGDNWLNRSTGLGISQIYRMASAPTNTNIWTAGSFDNGSSTRQSSSLVSSWLGGDGMEGLISPTNHLNIWGTCQNGELHRSTDGGNTESYLFNIPGGDWVTPLAMHPTNETIIFAGGSGIYKSTSSGSSFTQISPSITATISDIAVAPSNANYIYASTSNILYVTTNGGTSWSTNIISGAGQITDICVSPTNASKIWITTTNGRVRRSTNAGLNFTDITATLPAIAARTIVVDNSTNENLYVGMNIGVYTRNNTDTAWSVITSNLPRVAINELDIQQSSGRIRVATFGRGVWLYNPPSACVDIAEPNGSLSAATTININSTTSAQMGTATDLDFYKLTLTAASTDLQFSLSNLPANYIIQLTNSTGTVLQQNNSTGTGNKTFTRNGMTAGIYYVKISTPSGAYNTVQCYNLDVWQPGVIFARNGSENNSGDMEDTGLNTDAETRIALYPNPSNGLVNVDLSEVSDVASIVIMDNAGRILARHDNAPAHQRVPVDVSYLDQGVYIVQIITAKGVLGSMRLIKQ